ncbi:MAG: hypothetical protein NT048_05490 [Flavobacterium sp.]|nr:hypothetical protein [Flavobacterium sp.]
MKNCFKGVSMLFIIAMFFGCSKEDSTSLTLPPTTLKIIVNDDSGNPVSQAQVKIFGSQFDYYNNLNQLFTTKLTNNQGEASFSPVNTYDTYYWSVTKDCKTSVFDTNNNHNNLFLLSNAVNTYSISISDKGILTFNNNSSNPYKVYVNNVLKITNLAGNSTDSYFYSPGNYSIRVEQISGYLLYPTIKTYMVTLNCSGILTTTFPN